MMAAKSGAATPPVPFPGMPVNIAGAASPDAIAVAAADGSISYAALDRRAGALAAALIAHGVARGDVIAICLPRSIEGIAAMVAIWRVGAAYLPLDPDWPEARLKALIGGGDCAAVIAAPDVGARIAGGLPVIDPATVSPGAQAAPVAVTADDLAYVIYTSGSTGAPKAVEVTHGNLAALINWHIGAFDVRVGTCTSHVAGLGFDASVWEIWPTLSAGGTLVLIDDATRRDPVALRDWLVRERIEIAFVPTALAEQLVTLPWPEATALRTLLTGADKLTVRPPATLPFGFVNNYGPTEATVVATSGVVAVHGGALPSIGRAIAGTRIYLLDSAGREVARGEEGEIFIGGAQVARGYRGDPLLTAARFVDHAEHGRLYRTGDLACWTVAGTLAFRGRVDAQIKVRGHRIEPAKIVATINRLPEVAASVIVAHGSTIVAYVVPEPGAALVAVALRSLLAAMLPDYMVPGMFVALDALPMTTSGKVDLAALPDPASHAMPESPASRAPATPTERRLLEIVSSVIGRGDIGVDDDFFQIGGHSLLGTQVVVRARDAFGVELTLFHLFEGRTVARLASVIEDLIMAMLDGMSDDEIARMAG